MKIFKTIMLSALIAGSAGSVAFGMEYERQMLSARNIDEVAAACACLACSLSHSILYVKVFGGYAKVLPMTNDNDARICTIIVGNSASENAMWRIDLYDKGGITLREYDDKGMCPEENLIKACREFIEKLKSGWVSPKEKPRLFKKKPGEGWRFFINNNGKISDTLIRRLVAKFNLESDIDCSYILEGEGGRGIEPGTTYILVREHAIEKIKEVLGFDL